MRVRELPKERRFTEVAAYKIGSLLPSQAQIDLRPLAPMTSALDKYTAGESKTIEGWLYRIDAEILRTILTAQNVGGLTGSVAEIVNSLITLRLGFCCE